MPGLEAIVFLCIFVIALLGISDHSTPAPPRHDTLKNLHWDFYLKNEILRDIPKRGKILPIGATLVSAGPCHAHERTMTEVCQETKGCEQVPMFQNELCYDYTIPEWTRFTTFAVSVNVYSEDGVVNGSQCEDGFCRPFVETHNLETFIFHIGTFHLPQYRHDMRTFVQNQDTRVCLAENRCLGVSKEVFKPLFLFLLKNKDHGSPRVTVEGVDWKFFRPIVKLIY